MKNIDLSLYPLLLTLFDHNSEIWNSIMKYYWKVCLDHLKKNSKECQTEILPNNIQITTKYAFGILNEHVWKIKFKENLLLENYNKLSNENDKTIIECWNLYLNSDERDEAEKIKDTFRYLFNPYKDKKTLCILFQEVKEVKKIMNDNPSNYISKYEDELIHKFHMLKIRINNDKIILQVYVCYVYLQQFLSDIIFFS